MQKYFDEWNEKKKNLDLKNKILYCHAREVWWAVLGLNIGVEINGKNKNFERPVLILKSYNKDCVLILPLTTKVKKDKFHFEFKIGSRMSCAILTQPKLISVKRLSRKITVLDKHIFHKLLFEWKQSI